MAVLPLKQNQRFTWAFLGGQNDYGARVAHNLTENPDAGGLYHPLRGNPKDWTAVHHVRRQNSGWLLLGLEGFCHADNISDAGSGSRTRFTGIARAGND